MVSVESKRIRSGELKCKVLSVSNYQDCKSHANRTEDLPVTCFPEPLSGQKRTRNLGLVRLGKNVVSDVYIALSLDTELEI